MPASIRPGAWAATLAAALCGSVCSDEEPCWEGTERCDTECTSRRFDASNCGECGHACQRLEACDDGACVCEWRDGLEVCGGVCSDLSNDPLHCGDCETACPPEAPRCDRGGCTACPENECASGCTDLDSDRLNCGGCGHWCGGREVCFWGECLEPNSDECEPACDVEAGFLCCQRGSGPAECAHIADDNRYCGGCDYACDASPVDCTEGEC